jgi:hypothetical protein
MGHPAESTEALVSANESCVRNWTERSDISSCIKSSMRRWRAKIAENPHKYDTTV